ncbi:ABC transporter ATP-binding protein [uncultured Tyzzerella sp.]|uniref:ABC transporter ATP-binding protein n=1 Tax=uncultured Tyzzerella sp. TaxID=2321398 RepID=UPI002941D8B5|nr:ABC transporter ATP-binding protein [uncultured Tyzzerella sp.]
MEAFKWFYSFFKPYKKRYIYGLFLVTIATLLSFVNPYVIGIFVDDVMQKGDVSMLKYVLIGLIGSTIIKTTIRWYYLVLFEQCSQDILYNMRDKVYRKFMRQDFAFFNRNRTGDLMSRQIGDMDAIRHFTATFFAIYEAIIYFVVALIMCFTVNVKIGLYMILVLPFTLVLTLIQFKHVEKYFERIRDCFSSLNSFVQENISGNRMVRAFAKEDYEIQKFNKENEAYRESQLESTRVWSNYIPIFEFLSNALTVVLMFVGGKMAIQGSITVGGLIVIYNYLWMLNYPLRMSGWYINDTQRFLTSLDKIYKTIKDQPKIRRPIEAVSNHSLYGDIEFKNVSYQPEDDKNFDILKNVSFSIKKGQTLGIIGATGAGKSTAVNLLSRFYDATEGEITIDGIPIKDIDIYWLRDNIGMAMQDVFLFSDTIEGNIAYGDPNCPFEKVEWAAKTAGAHDFIEKMPEGYDTIVGERGVGLSGGQKQRISLARALLKEPSILILDDTTSALDMETEHMIQENLKLLDKECTKVLIAYRISSIMEADLILVLDKGEIVERGTHEELLAQEGYYYSVFHHQYGDFREGRL